MPNIPYFPFYVNDWLGSTTITCLTPAQEGGFIRLLAHSWNKPGCLLTGTQEDLMALSRLDSQALAGLLAKAYQSCEGGYYNAKQRRVRKDYELYSKSMSEAGKKGAQRRKELRLKEKEALAGLQQSLNKASGKAEAKVKPSLALAPSLTSLNKESKPKEDAPSQEPTTLESPPNKKKSKKEDYVFEGIPDWVNQQSWDGYLAMRKKIKAPLTDWGKHLTVLDLAALQKTGTDPNKSLDQSSQKSWRGVFRITEGGNGSGTGRYHRQGSGRTAAEARGDTAPEGKYADIGEELTPD